MVHLRGTRLARALGAATILIGLTAGAVAAGEVTGTGEATPIADYRASSICSFSGLNDRVQGEGPTEPRVQSFGQVVRTVGPIGGIPGEACRGYPSH